MQHVESNMSCLDNWIVNGCIITNKTKHLLLQNILKFILKLCLKFIINSFKKIVIFKNLLMMPLAPAPGFFSLHGQST